MPFLLILYLSALAITALLGVCFFFSKSANTILRGKRSALHELYELLSVASLILMCCAYYSEFLRFYMGGGTIFAFVVIILFDFYTTVFADRKELGLEEVEITQSEFEFARCTSIIYLAPAYIFSAFLCYRIL